MTDSRSLVLGLGRGGTCAHLKNEEEHRPIAETFCDELFMEEKHTTHFTIAVLSKATARAEDIITHNTSESCQNKNIIKGRWEHHVGLTHPVLR